MTAIPDVGGARCAPRGVLCALLLGALLRVAVLGGLVIAGWLLGSGISQAHEDLVQQDLAQQDSMVRLAGFPLPDDDSGGPLDTPPTVKSTVTSVMRAAPVPQLPVRPPQVPELTPVLAPVSKLADPAPVTRSQSQSQATTHKPAVVAPPPAPAEPAVRSATVVTPAPVLHTVRSAPPATPACLAAQPVADPLAAQFADTSVLQPSPLGSGPAAPAPASPFGTTTTPCPSGSPGGGAITNSVHSATLSDGWSGMDLNSTYCPLRADASGMPRAAAQRPCTSPD